MSQQVIRAAQTNYEVSLHGTRDDGNQQGRNVRPFMDALEVEETKFLNSLKRGAAGRDRKEYGGAHAVMPRGSKVSAATLAAATTLPVIPGHGARFQQGHVLLVKRASDGATERMWVNADPDTGGLSVSRAQAGDTALAFAAGDEIRVIGIAMPQLSNFPLSPVTRGKKWWNTYQNFEGHLEFSHQGTVSPDDEFPDGDWMDRDMLDLGRRMKRELNEALLLGGRQEGNQDPDAPVPSLMGGVMFYAENAGNVYSGGGAAVALAVELFDDALADLDQKYGDKFGTRLLMSPKTKRVMNRIAAPARDNSRDAFSGGILDIRWEGIETDLGTYKFTTMDGIPDGTILIYKDTNQEYAPFQGMDWSEKDSPTEGNWYWRGISGSFTYRPKHADAFAIVNNFSMDLSDYPALIRTAY
jgi:hypothetical protein